MSKHTIWRILILVLLFVLSVSSIQAQIELDEHYTSHDGSFSFNYPDHGQASLDDQSYVGSVQITIPLYEQDYTINVFSPWLTQIQINGAQSLEEASGALRQSMNADEVPIEFNIVQTYRMLEFFDETDGFWVLIELEDGGFGLIGVHAERQRRSRLRDLARAIALSYSYRYPVIESYAENWQNVISELQSKALIAEAGNLVFSELDSFMLEQSVIVDEYPAHVNVVMSAEITVSGNARCGLMAHVQSWMLDEAEETFSLSVTVNAYEPYSGIGYSDNFGVISRAFMFRHRPIEAESTHHYLLITDDHDLSIYVDGSPLVEHVPIAPVEGYYGLYFDTMNADGECHVRDFWVFEYDEPVTEETCHALVVNEAEGRLWPNDDRVIRTFSEGEIIPLACHHRFETGETWYLLRNGLWIEARHVELQGECLEIIGIY